MAKRVFYQISNNNSSTRNKREMNSVDCHTIDMKLCGETLKIKCPKTVKDTAEQSAANLRGVEPPSRSRVAAEEAVSEH